VEHPLQAFSPRAFGADPDPRLSSFARHHAAGARALAGPSRQPAPFLTQPLAPPAAEWEAENEVELEALVRFFRAAGGTWLTQRLNIHVPRTDDPAEDREPLDLEGLDRWKVGQAMLEKALTGADPESALSVFQASGRLPPGALGESVREELLAEVGRIAHQVEALREGKGRVPVRDLSLDLDGTRLRGQLDTLWPSGQIRHGFGRVTSQELDAWIRHLAFCATEPDAESAKTFLVGRGKKTGSVDVVCFTGVTDAKQRLAELVDLFGAGLLAPLPFFTSASRDYFDSVHRKPEDVESAILNARDAFGYSEFRADQRSDRERDAALRLLYAETDPIDPLGGGKADALGFSAIARTVFAPLVEHREELG
jgi:exodeoxyribonuclease V gamma subunit